MRGPGDRLSCEGVNRRSGGKGVYWSPVGQASSAPGRPAAECPPGGCPRHVPWSRPSRRLNRRCGSHRFPKARLGIRWNRRCPPSCVREQISTITPLSDPLPLLTQGDRPQAMADQTEGLSGGDRFQTPGRYSYWKTPTMAHVITNHSRPTLGHVPQQNREAPAPRPLRPRGAGGRDHRRPSSCIYGLDPRDHLSLRSPLEVSDEKPRKQILRGLVDIHHKRDDLRLRAGYLPSSGRHGGGLPGLRGNSRSGSSSGATRSSESSL